MIILPSNCRCGKFSVFPSNWKTAKANKNLMWRISYWFYDDNLNQKRKVVIKGMNSLETLKEKQDTVKFAISEEIYRLKDQGYNPLTKSYQVTSESTEISEFTPFVEALNYAYNNLHAEPETKTDIKSCLKQITAAIKALHYDRLTISQVRRKHIRFVFDQCEKMKDYWSNNLFNHYRKYLSILFKQLVNIDVVDTNPVREIEKRSSLKRIRQTLSKDERIKVNEFLHDNYYTFWRFVQIFFHAGCRETELMKVKKKDVEIINQRYKVEMKKGRKHSEEWRTIKTIAIPIWNELISLAKDEDYLFSWGLIPGEKKNSVYQVRKRWHIHVQEKLGIKAGLYSLKYSNLDEVAEILELKAAQEMAGHSTPVVTMIYAQGEGLRKHNRLKDVDNAF